MSEQARKMTRVSSSSGSYDKRPIDFYYQYKPSESPHPKVKVLQKGDTFAGKYLWTFTDVNEGFQNHLIEDETNGKVSIKGATILNNALAEVPKGTYIEMTYDGTGEKKKGRRPPYLWTIDIEEGTPSLKPKVVTTAPAGKPATVVANRPAPARKAAPAPVVEDAEILEDDTEDDEVPF